ncbi:MAG: PAS domain S-box protein [Phycisphaerae bacterium]
MADRPKHAGPAGPDELRHLAEQLLGGKLPEDLDPDQALALLHELQVHRVELEVQNEQLRETQRDLVEANRRYSSFFENAPVGYLMLNAKGEILRVNRRAVEMTGLNQDELVGNRIERLVAPKHRDACYRMLRKAGENEGSSRCRARLELSAGETTWVSLETELNQDEDRAESTGYCVNMVDISRQVRIEQQLETQAIRLQLALHGGQIGLWQYDLESGQMYWSEMLYQLLGRDLSEPIDQQTFFNYIHPEDRQRVRQKAFTWFRQGDRFQEEFRILREDGELRWLTAVGQVLESGPTGGKIAIGINYDITDRKNLLDEVSRSRDRLDEQVRQRTAQLQDTVEDLRKEISRRHQAEQDLKNRTEQLEASNLQLAQRSRLLQKLAADLSVAEDRERRNLGEFLHDHLQQILIGAKFHLEAVNLEKIGPRWADMVSKALEQIDEAVLQSRLLSHELSPPLLAEQGPQPALRWLGEKMREHYDLEVDIQIGSQLDDLPEHVICMIYKAVREMLMNIVKHADVDAAELEVYRESGQLVVCVSDKGKGFDTTQELKEGLGLQTIRERVQALDGQLHIDSIPGDGVRMRITLPL